LTLYVIQVSDFFSAAQVLADAWTTRVGFIEMTIPKCREMLKHAETLIIRCLTLLNAFQKVHESHLDSETRAHFAACFGDTSEWALWNT
jgi:hypothetical protein